MGKGSVHFSLEWNIHYARWMIDDGTPDRRLGETFDWPAIEFWSEISLASTPERKKSAEPVGDYEYRVVAEVLYVGESTCIIDFGLKTISNSDSLRSGCREGEHVTGQISLSFADYTFVAPDSVFRHLRYGWYVNRISADLTPFVPIPNSEGGWMRDRSTVRYSNVAGTDEVQTHSYVLHCTEITS